MEKAKTKETLQKIATMYYVGNQSQEKIAKSMDFSNAKVSRLLEYARKTRVVEFKINKNPVLIEEWAAKIKNHFGLKDVIIAPSSVNQSDSKVSVGKAAAVYLDSLLANGIHIGLAWGTTNSELVKHFQPTRTIQGSWVIQLNGGSNIASDTLHIDGTELVKTLARKINAYSSILQAPCIVENRLLRKLFIEEKVIREHFEKYDLLDVAIVGFSSQIPEESIAFKAGYISREESQLLIESGFAADLCGNRFFVDGQEMDNPLTGRVISIPLQTLKKVPVKIAVAEGERKAASAISSLKGGYVNVLIIDELLALEIMFLAEIR